MIDKAMVGETIYALRKRMGITQDSLAQVINVTPQAISKWENGITLPDTGLLPRLAELFEISIEELLGVVRKRSADIGKDNRHKVLLPGLTYYPGTPTLVSCIRSSLHYLGIHVSLGWISAPYAFMLNINEEVSAKGPEYWSDNGCFRELIRNCGGIIDTIQGHKSDMFIAQQRKEAWRTICDAIDKGLPSYAWEMDKPLFYLIAGYGESGYYYIEPQSGKVTGPKSYDELGNSEWGILEIHTIRPGSISDSLKTIKDVFEYAINVGDPSLYRPNAGYTMGAEAYRVWWEVLSIKQVDHYNLAYNAAFWANCKRLACLFLQESKLRLGILDHSFDLAISHYGKTAKYLSQLAQLFPLHAADNACISQQMREEAIRLLKHAQRSELNGLMEITSILNEIYKIW